MVTRYERGRNAEYAVIKYFRDKLNCTVTRSAGSKGPWDLVAVNSEGVFFVQVKSYTGEKEPAYKDAEASLKKVDIPLESGVVHKQIAVYKYGKGIVDIREVF